MSEDPFGYNAVSETTASTPTEAKPQKKTTASSKADTEKAPGNKQTESKRTGIASRGAPVTTDQFPEQPLPTWDNRESAYDISDAENFDFEDLAEINRALNRSRVKFYRIGSQLKEAQRHLSDAKTSYNRRMRRELLNISGGTEKTRVAMAELACEPWENDVAVTTQLVAELTNEQRIASKELDILESLANNARAQIKIM